jgi:hypothetical protein
LQEMPGATSSHSGSARHGGADITGAWPVSAAILCARRSHRDAAGRSTSVGQETKDDGTKRLQFLLAIRTRGDMSLHDGTFVRRKDLQDVQEHRFQAVPIVVARFRSWLPDSELIGPSSPFPD